MTSKTWNIPDLFITVPVILLLSLGILILYSSDPRLALQQGLFAIFGLLLYFILSFIDFEFYSQYIKYLYIFVLALLVVVFLIGFETRGSLRWIPFLGIQLQPSELAKPILILLLANFWSRNPPNWTNIGKSLLLIFPAVALIFKQPDLGTTLTLIAIWVVMLIGVNVSLVKLLAMGVITSVFTPLFWFFLKSYQKDRVLSFLSPERDPLGIGYNVIQSTIAVGSGQFAGRGLGRGTQSRLQFLPEYRTDFMFASIAEELGFIGSVLVLLLYGLLVGRSLQIITNAGSRFSALLVFGALGMLFFQIAVNIGMNIGLAPVTGITLPLLSYGGSSLVATLISLSFIASCARFSRKQNNNYD